MAAIDIDPFRQQYRELSEEEKRHVVNLKGYATELYKGLLDANMPRPGCDPRCLALARTKLEEAVFWAVKAITN
jgi:hypothetical protein